MRMEYDLIFKKSKRYKTKKWDPKLGIRIRIEIKVSGIGLSQDLGFEFNFSHFGFERNYKF